jgi:hypothetical protein
MVQMYSNFTPTAKFNSAFISSFANNGILVVWSCSVKVEYKVRLILHSVKQQL